MERNAKERQTRPLESTSKIGAMGVIINFPLFPSQYDSLNGMMDIKAVITSNEGNDR